MIRLAALGWTLLLSAQGSRDWRPEERAVISDYSIVTALAASESRVYVATRNGLGIYDWRLREWEPPVSLLDGYPRLPVHAALADPTEEAVWLATAEGVVRYRPQIRQWETILIPGGVSDLMYDGDDPLEGMFLRTRRGWELLRPGAVIPATARNLPPPGRRVTPMSVEDLERQFPVADAMRAEVLLDDRLRTFRYTTAVRVPRIEEVYLGTNGMGVLRLDLGIVRFERLPFGLVASGAGAVAAVPGGVWAGSDHRALRPGFTFVGERLQRYVWKEGPRRTGFAFAGVRDVVVRRREVWGATDRGVIRVDVDGDDAVRLTSGDGLPDDQVYALGQGGPGVWIGTALGLALARDGGEIRRVGPRQVTVLALAPFRDSVWVGTTAGLGLAWAAGERIVVPPDVDALPELKAAIIALALAGDTLVAATTDRLVWRAGADEWLVERVLGRELGVIYALAPDDGGVWVGGELGVGFYRYGDRTFVIVARRGDVPGPVRDLSVGGDYLWVATEGGAVRFLRRALVP